jgi:5-methylcytosine-specific restriction endonuclease McrA
MRKRIRRLGFTCKACHFHWRKRVLNPRYGTNSGPRCPSCGARDALEDAGNNVVRMKLGYFLKYVEPARQSPTKATPWREVYEAYMGSPPWRSVRALVLERDRACLACKRTTDLHVHHLHYRTLGQETGKELITLCLLCHKLEHESGSLRERERLWRVDPVRGDGFHHLGAHGSKPVQGGSVQHQSGSAKPEAAGTAG